LCAGSSLILRKPAVARDPVDAQQFAALIPGGVRAEHALLAGLVIVLAFRFD
jgi:hypothetical protein